MTFLIEPQNNLKIDFIGNASRKIVGCPTILIANVIGRSFTLSIVCPANKKL